jgi:hypothetical protein
MHVHASRLQAAGKKSAAAPAIKGGRGARRARQGCPGDSEELRLQASLCTSCHCELVGRCSPPRAAAPAHAAPQRRRVPNLNLGAQAYLLIRAAQEREEARRAVAAEAARLRGAEAAVAGLAAELERLAAANGGLAASLRRARPLGL